MRKTNVPPTTIIGLIPAAGHGTRLGNLPFSKELYPVGGRSSSGGEPKVVSHYLLENMAAAGVSRALFVLRAGKRDISDHFGDGSIAGLPLEYLTVEATPSPLHTLDAAFPVVRNSIVAMGFPDILFKPPDLFRIALDHLRDSGTDLVLPLLPANRPDKYDVIDADESGAIREIVIKPSHAKFKFSWVVAVWTPAFTEFLHDYLAGDPGAGQPVGLSVAHSFRAAIREGLKVRGVPVPNGASLDIGTPDDLERAAAFASEIEET